MGARRIAYKILTGKPTGRKTTGGPRRRWEDNFTINNKIN